MLREEFCKMVALTNSYKGQMEQALEQNLTKTQAAINQFEKRVRTAELFRTDLSEEVSRLK